MISNLLGWTIVVLMAVLVIYPASRALWQSLPRRPARPAKPLRRR